MREYKLNPSDAAHDSTDVATMDVSFTDSCSYVVPAEFNELLIKSPINSGFVQTDRMLLLLLIGY